MPLNKQLFQPIKNYLFKPTGGLWSSTYLPNHNYHSAWQWFCDRQFGGEKKYRTVFEFKKDTKVYTIDNYINLRDLAINYPFDPHPDLELFTSFVDYEKLAEDYDVVHLTLNGQTETAYSFPLSLWGWNVECCLVMDYDCIEIVAE